ncbi:hypothetical protein IMSAGC009_04505 [Lachnospiraceae bacterium]|nr:hypothetical protein IMSAGC009_04505 [Lachnospiraceae bacterium]
MKNLILVHLESLNSIFFDTKKDLFPNIEKIKKESIYYNNFFSTATSTLMVISDICYGGMYRESCSSLEDDNFRTENNFSMFDKLKESGYETKGIIWPQISTYTKMKAGQILGEKIEIEALKKYAGFLEAIENQIKGDKQFALFVGNFASHVSYRNDKEVGGANAYSKWKKGYHFIDDTCGKIVKLLKKYEKEDNTIVIFYGDHGDDLWGHGLKNGYIHAIEPYSNIIHTPLIVKCPGEKKRISDELISAIDIKEMAMKMVFDVQDEINALKKRSYVFARNIFVNQKINFMSLGKGYSVISNDYSLMVTMKGLELYNICMDPVNSCNLLEFFDIDSGGNIKFRSQFKNIKSWHFRHFFVDAEIRHLNRIYKQLRIYLLNATKEIYEGADKNIDIRNKELNFHKINRYHFFNIYHRIYAELIDKAVRFYMGK